MAKTTKSVAVAKSYAKTVQPSSKATLKVATQPDESPTKTLARVSLEPGIRHAQLAMSFASCAFADDKQPSIMESSAVLAESLAKAERGDKRLASRLLASQAISLDTIFTEMARRSAVNMGEYPAAQERYMRLALKAQTACRTTLETLAKLHQPREQTVKHVHVNDGGQAVVTDQFHNHTGGGQNEKSDEQSHTTGAVGESPALLGQDPQGNGVPIPSSEGEAAMQNARGD